MNIIPGLARSRRRCLGSDSVHLRLHHRAIPLKPFFSGYAMDDDLSTKQSTSPGRFCATHWTVVGVAGGDDSSEGRAAFGELYAAYFPPLLTYLRYKGNSRDRAMDLLQGFFGHLLATNGLRSVEKKGRFRSWLLKVLNNFVHDQRDKDQAMKRGGGQIHLPIGPDFADGEIDPLDMRLSPEQAYDRKWAITLLNRVLSKLATKYVTADDRKIFDEMKTFLAGNDRESNYGEVAERLNMKPNTVAARVKRLREEYADLLWAELSDTVDPEMMEQEWRHLQAALCGP